MSTLMSIPYELNCISLYNVKEINSSFASGTLKVMYLGNNRNGTHFSKHAVQNALPSLRNVPIVCRWDSESETIGGHDVAVVKDDDGGLRLKNLTDPCGVVPEHAQFMFQKDCDDDGNEHEYLIIDGVILWKRQDVYRYIVNDLDGKVKHSMEIHVSNSNETPDGYQDITDFEFTALCLLGDVEPCFEGSELELYSAQNFKQKMEQMMLELKDSLSQVNTSAEVDNIHPQNYSTEGGKEALEEKQILSEDMSVETQAEQVENTGAESALVEEEPSQEDSTQDKYELTSNIVSEICRALGEVKIQDEYCEFPRYWYIDCDIEAKEVYCWDCLDSLLYGFSYIPNGDNIIIDYDSKKRKKYSIVDFDEGEQMPLLASVSKFMQENLCNNAEWEAKYQTASDKIESMTAELGELRQFKVDTEKAVIDNKKDAIFAQFEDLTGVESFESLRENADEYDIETLEEKCFAIRGKNGSSIKFTSENKVPKLKIEVTEQINEPYGGIFAKYGVDAE